MRLLFYFIFLVIYIVIFVGAWFVEPNRQHMQLAALGWLGAALWMSAAVMAP
jgi:hypothetical protein